MKLESTLADLTHRIWRFLWQSEHDVNVNELVKPTKEGDAGASANETLISEDQRVLK